MTRTGTNLGSWLRTRLERRVLRARHNDHDFACRFWFGDRNPNENDRTNHDFGGDPTRLDQRRCLVCRPFDDQESGTLLDLAPLTTGRSS